MAIALFVVTDRDIISVGDLVHLKNFGPYCVAGCNQVQKRYRSLYIVTIRTHSNTFDVIVSVASFDLELLSGRSVHP